MTYDTRIKCKRSCQGKVYLLPPKLDLESEPEIIEDSNDILNEVNTAIEPVKSEQPDSATLARSLEAECSFPKEYQDAINACNEDKKHCTGCENGIVTDKVKLFLGYDLRLKTLEFLMKSLTKNEAIALAFILYRVNRVQEADIIEKIWVTKANAEFAS